MRNFPSRSFRFNLQSANEDLVVNGVPFWLVIPQSNIEMEFTKSFSAGFFDGQGFVLQKLSGEGDVLNWEELSSIRNFREGETLRVASGSIVAFESTIE
jgi:uncharacterized protein (AIM24 family)